MEHQLELPFMEDLMSKNYYKGSGPGGAVGATHAGNTANNTGGTGGESVPQKPIPGPEHTGLPISMKRALAKKDTSPPGAGLPNKNTTGAGSVR
jgi:hypothetical protein